MRIRFGAVRVGIAWVAGVVCAGLACSSKEDAAPSDAGAGGTQSEGEGGSAPGGSSGSSGGGRAPTGGSGAAGSGTAGSSSGSAGRAGSTGGASGGATATGGSSDEAGAPSGGTARGGSSGSGGTGGGPTTPCDDDCHYVRAAATGSADGSTWEDAYTELPSELERGHVYFVAAGTYPGYAFDDSESGDERISIVRARDDDHGDDTGWRPEYHDGQADFGELRFETGRYTLEGRSGIRAVGGFGGTVVRIEADSVDFRGVDVDGYFALDGDQHAQGACTGMLITGDDVTARGNVIHDIADDGVVVSGSNNLDFEANEIRALYGCGTDGGCGPCDNGHSDGLEIYAVRNSRFAANFAHDIASTSTFFFGNWADELGDGPAEYCENILLENNILYNPDTGFVAYIEDARGVRLYHNTIWGQHDGRYGGLAIGVNVSGLEVVNNAILSINYSHLGGSFDAAEHGGDYNLFGKSIGEWQEGAHDLIANNPGFVEIPDGDGAKVENPDPSQFAPVGGSPLEGAGTTEAASALPSVDFWGFPRGAPPTLGAIE